MPRESKRADILDAGLALMWERGFEAVGIQDIARASGVPKGSFYNHFDSKEAFAVVAIETYTERMAAHLEQTLLQGRGSHLGRLRKLLRNWAQQFEDEDGGGCLAGNLSQEMALRCPPVQDALRASFRSLEGHYRACLERAQSAAELPADADTRLLAHWVYNSWQGAIVRAKAVGSPAPLRSCIEMIFTRLLV